MNLWDYYRILGLRQGASDDEIRKAYRLKALEYHPDRNHSENAHNMFVAITEAYQYLISHPYGRNISEDEYRKNYQAWVDYRQAQARKKAEEYARVSFYVFRQSPIYKSTTVIDGTMVFMGLGLAIATIAFALYGYLDRLARAATPREKPSVALFALTMIVGGAYLFISFLYLAAWLKQRKERKNGKESQDQKSV